MRMLNGFVYLQTSTTIESRGGDYNPVSGKWNHFPISGA